MLKAIHAQDSKAAAMAKAKDISDALREMKLKGAARIKCGGEGNRDLDRNGKEIS